MTAYTRVDDPRKKPRSGLDAFLNRLPYYFSHVILITTWFLFTAFITVGEILLRRRELGRFLEQIVIYHFLLGMTLLSLLTTASRAPQAPDQTLAPPVSVVPGTRARECEPMNTTSSSPARTDMSAAIGGSHDVAIDNDDDVPLRILRNAQWMSGRTQKDRPSPLPLANTQHQPPDSTHQGHTSHAMSATDSHSDYSPFPLSARGFVPRTASEAGEDDVEQSDDRAIKHIAEGSSNSDSDAQKADTDALLSARSEPSELRSLMAKSNTGEVRWCKKCDAWKPDRTHHCRHCRQCVLKMDHHCPWVGNCVGLHNYKAFLLFVNYGLLLAVYITIEAGYESIRFLRDPDAAISHSQIVQLEAGHNATGGCLPGAICTSSTSELQSGAWTDTSIVSPAVAMMLGIMGAFMTMAMGGLALFHWYLASHNQTTLENITHAYPAALLDVKPTGAQWKADHLLTRSERMRLREEAREINVYDLGWRSNLSALLLDGREVSGLGWMRALWPAGRSSVADARAGHFFPYDPEKFDQLRQLTLELRSLEATESDTYEKDVSISSGERGSQTGMNRKERVRWFEV
ncbi:hypothetical protein IAU60_001500 [Kwoniella sp. DSM 27419]